MSTNTSESRNGRARDADERRPGADRVDDRARERVAERHAADLAEPVPGADAREHLAAGCGSAAPSPRPSRRSRPRTPRPRRPARSTTAGAGSASSSGATQVAKKSSPATNSGRSKRTRSMSRPPSSMPTENPVRITPQANAPPSSRLRDHRADDLERRHHEHQEEERVDAGRATASGACAPPRSPRATRLRKRVPRGARRPSARSSAAEAGGADRRTCRRRAPRRRPSRRGSRRRRRAPRRGRTRCCA